MKRHSILIISIILFILTGIASFFFIKEQTSPSIIFLSTTKLEKGMHLDVADPLFKTYFKPTDIFSKVNFDAVIDINTLNGKFVATDIPKGTVITENLFSDTSNLIDIPKGYAHISIWVTNYTAATENDYVDVVGFINQNGIRATHPLANNIKVIDVSNKNSLSIDDELKNSDISKYEDLTPYRVVLEMPRDFKNIISLYDQIFIYPVNRDDVETALDDSPNFHFLNIIKSEDNNIIFETEKDAVNTENDEIGSTENEN